jgi:hypothetical protein
MQGKCGLTLLLKLRPPRGLRMSGTSDNWRTTVTSLVTVNDRCLKLSLGSSVLPTEPFMFFSLWSFGACKLQTIFLVNGLDWPITTNYQHRYYGY